MEEQTRDLNVILIEYWNSFLEILPKLGLALVVLLIGFFVARWLAKVIRQRLLSRAQDPLMAEFLGKVAKGALYVLVFLLALKVAGFGAVVGTVLAGAGVSAVVLGFAFKDIGENFLAGVILAFGRPFDVNDTIEVDGIFGKVKALQIRYTHIKTFDGKDVYVPNAQVMTNPVTNYTADGYIRFDFMVGIAYEDRIQDAKDLIIKTIEANPEVLHGDDHPAFVVEHDLGVSTMNLKAFFWVDASDYRKGALEAKGNVIREVKEALEDNGFYLPADIQEIKLYGNAEPLDLRVSMKNGQERNGQSAKEQRAQKASGPQA